MPNQGIERWVPNDWTAGLVYPHSIHILKGSVQVALISSGDGVKVVLGSWLESVFRYPPAIWNTSLWYHLISRRKEIHRFPRGCYQGTSWLFWNRAHLLPKSLGWSLTFSARHYDGTIGCMWRKLCSRVSTDHLRLSLDDSRVNFGMLLTYRIHQK